MVKSTRCSLGRVLVGSFCLGGACLGGAPAAGAAAWRTQHSPPRVEAAAAVASSDTVVPTVVASSSGSAALAPSASSAGLPGPWICPVAIGKFTNDWGQPRSGGRVHEGNDMLAPRGTPVLAPVGGIVKRSTSASGGLTFNLKGDDGFTYVGMHLSEFGADGAVRGGDVVGFVGDTGNARGTSHLHFEIQVGKGQKFNPFATLRRYCS